MTTQWSDKDIRLLIDWYRDHEGKPLDLDALAAQVGRLKSNVARKARSLGLTDQRRPKVERINGLMPCEIRRQPKHQTVEERNRSIGDHVRQRIAEKGHPRGALGMKHSESSRQIIGEKSKVRHAGKTQEERSATAQKAVSTRLEKYGTGGPSFLLTESPYSRGKRGYIDDIPGIHFRSMWECNYARYLDWLIDQGEIQSWEYEVDTFIFHGVTRAPVTYTPDFKVTERDGSVVYHEVKGWMDGKSKSKLQRMKKFYPAVTVIVIDEAGYKSIANWSATIPNWGVAPRSRKEIEEAGGTVVKR